MGHITEAISDYSKAIQLDSRNAAAFNSRGLALDRFVMHSTPPCRVAVQIVILCGCVDRVVAVMRLLISRRQLILSQITRYFCTIEAFVYETLNAMMKRLLTIPGLLNWMIRMQISSTTGMCVALLPCWCGVFAVAQPINIVLFELRQRLCIPKDRALGESD